MLINQEIASGGIVDISKYTSYMHKICMDQLVSGRSDIKNCPVDISMGNLYLKLMRESLYNLNR